MIVGVVPAAGRATRLQPLEGSKELCPVRGRPVMDHLVERMRLGGCSQLRVVARPEKLDVIAHAGELGAVVIQGRPRSVAASLLLGAAELDPGDVVLFGFPDTLWDPPEGFARLVSELGVRYDIVLGVFDSREPQRSDVVVLGEDGAVRSIQVKPARPDSTLVWGCLATTVAALDGLEAYDEPGRFLDEGASGGRIGAVRFDSELVDIGTPESFAAHVDLERAR